MIKFYHAENANRVIKSGDLRIVFNVYGHFGSTWRGVYEATKPEEIAALDLLVADPSSAITEITKEVYDSKKKVVTVLPDALTRFSAPPVPAEQINPIPGALLVENPEAVKAAKEITPEDVLSVGKIPGSKVEQVEEPAPKKKASKAKATKPKAG